MREIRILLLEDDADFAYLIKKRISEDPSMRIVGVADRATAGIRLAKELHPDLALIDLNLLDGTLSGVRAAHDIRLSTNAKVLLLTSVEREDVVIDASKRAYASGYIKKSACTSLLTRISETVASLTPEALFIKTLLLSILTDAERYVLQQFLNGDEPSSSPKTIANQKTSIFRKLGVKNQKELMRIIRNF